MTDALYYVLDHHKHGGMKYKLAQEINYYSGRYGEWIVVPEGRLSDGATGACDIPESISWWVHDELCENAAFYNGTPCTAWQASMVLRDILKEEGHGIRARFWTWATFLLGSWKNKTLVGWYNLKEAVKEDNKD